MNHKNIPRILSVFLLLVLLTSCQLKIEVSSDAEDSDFSAFNSGSLVGDGFTIQPDVRVFTLYAYLNGVAGLDQENGDRFSPERTELRKVLKDHLTKVNQADLRRWRSFYEQHQQIPYRYLYYTMTLGTPPEFNHIIPVEEIQYPEIVQSLKGFNQVLAEFYIGVGIEELYELRFRDQMVAEVKQYDQERIANQLNYVYKYLRLDRSQWKSLDVVVIPAPFNSHYDANALIFEKQLFIVEGPGSNDYGLNIHEYLHMLMDDLIPEDFAGQKAYFESVWRENKDAEYVKNSYGSVHSFVEECMVRALDHRMRIALEPEKQDQEEAVLRDETLNGLVLAEEFYRALDEYEQDPALDIRTFIKDTFKDLPQSKK